MQPDIGETEFEPVEYDSISAIYGMQLEDAVRKTAVYLKNLGM